MRASNDSLRIVCPRTKSPDQKKQELLVEPPRVYETKVERPTAKTQALNSTEGSGSTPLSLLKLPFWSKDPLPSSPPPIHPPSTHKITGANVEGGVSRILIKIIRGIQIFNKRKLGSVYSQEGDCLEGRPWSRATWAMSRNDWAKCIAAGLREGTRNLAIILPNTSKHEKHIVRF